MANEGMGDSEPVQERECVGWRGGSRRIPFSLIAAVFPWLRACLLPSSPRPASRICLWAAALWQFPHTPQLASHL